MKVVIFYNSDLLHKFQKLITQLFEGGDFNSSYLIIACYGVAEIASDYLYNIVRNTYEYSLANAPLSIERVVDLN